MLMHYQFIFKYLTLNKTYQGFKQLICKVQHNNKSTGFLLFSYKEIDFVLT